MLTRFEFVLHALSIFNVRELITSSSLLISDKSEILRFLIAYETSLIKAVSSSLFFAIENLDETMFSSVIGMETVRGAWSEEIYQLEWIEWLLSSVEPLHRNTRSMTEFDSPTISKYLVGIWLVEIDKSKLNEFAIIMRLLLIDEW